MYTGCIINKLNFVAKESHMRNDDLTKLARWIVPGWLTFLTFLGFVIIDIFITPEGGTPILSQGEINTILNFFDENDVSTSSEALFIAVVGVAAGVPVGFIVYQVYFFLRWNSPFSRDGFLSLIPGRNRDIQKSIQDLHEELAFTDEWRKDILDHILYWADHSFKYRYIESLFIEACQLLDKGTEVSIFSRHRYLHEVVHTLGASIGALYVGFFGYLTLRLLKEELSASIYLPIVFILIVLFFGLMHGEDHWRTQKAMNLKTEKGNDRTKYPPILHLEAKKKLIGFAFPSSQVLLTFVFFHFFGNPKLSPPEIPDFAKLISLNPDSISAFLSSLISAFAAIFKSLVTTKLGLRLALTFGVLGVWVGTLYDKSNQKFMKGSFLWATLTVTGCLLLVMFPEALFWWVDWTFFFSFVLFLMASLVLFSNRRNANDDMLMLEYYTLRRYLDTQTKPKKQPVQKRKKGNPKPKRRKS